MQIQCFYGVLNEGSEKPQAPESKNQTKESKPATPAPEPTKSLATKADSSLDDEDSLTT